MTSPARSAADPVLVAVCRCAGVVSGLTVGALLLFYAVDLRTGAEHGFGPLSDIGTVAWNVLLLPLLVGFRAVLGPQRPADLLGAATALVCVAGAGASALLVAEVAPFEVATAVAVLAVLVQSLWLHVLSRRLRGTGWPVWLLRLGFWGPVAQGFGALAFAVSLLVDWGSTPQLVIMAVGVAPGLLSWLGWPVWFLGAAAALSRADVPLPISSSVPGSAAEVRPSVPSGVI